MIDIPNSLKEALAEAKQLRTCPSMEAIASGNVFALKHLQTCESCKEFFELYKKRKDKQENTSNEMNLSQTKAEFEQDLTNCVCRIQCPIDDRFKDGLYFDPPLVFVLPARVEDNNLLVAQISNDIELAYAGDVPIDDGIYFIESWNIYKINKNKLKYIDGPLQKIIEQRVLAESKISYTNFPYPQIREFRDLEKTIGEFYSNRYSSDLTNDFDKNVANDSYFYLDPKYSEHVWSNNIPNTAKLAAATTTEHFYFENAKIESEVKGQSLNVSSFSDKKFLIQLIAEEDNMPIRIKIIDTNNFKYSIYKEYSENNKLVNSNSKELVSNYLIVFPGAEEKALLLENKRIKNIRFIEI